MSNTGGNIKKIRRFKGITQQELADKLEVSLKTVSRIETGKTPLTLTTLGKIAKILKVELREILDYEKDEVKPIPAEGWIELPLLNKTFRVSSGKEDGFPNAVNNAKSTIVVAKEWIEGDLEPYTPFGLTVEGDSMEQAGIPDGSIAIINPNIRVESGDIGLFRMDGSWMLKGAFWKSDGGAELLPANPNYQRLSFSKDEFQSDWIKTIGKVVYIIQAGRPKKFL